MKLRDARTLSPEALFERRKQAILLFQRGMSRIAVARVVGVHRTVVGEWVKAWQEGGEDALHARPGGRPRGRGRSLPVPVIAEMWRTVADTLPPDHGLKGTLWSVRTVRDWLLRRLGKAVPARTVTNYFHAWGLRPPAGPRGLGDAFQDWLRQTFRRTKQATGPLRRPVWWLDAVTLTAPATGETLHLLMAATSLGSARFFPLRRPASEAEITRFLESLRVEAGGPVMVVVPGPCLAAHPGWTALERIDLDQCDWMICPPY